MWLTAHAFLSGCRTMFLHKKPFSQQSVCCSFCYRHAAQGPAARATHGLCFVKSCLAQYHSDGPALLSGNASQHVAESVRACCQHLHLKPSESAPQARKFCCFERICKIVCSIFGMTMKMLTYNCHRQQHFLILQHRKIIRFSITFTDQKFLPEPNSSAFT